MHPLTLIAILSTIWVLLHLWLLPLSKSQWQASDMRAKMARAGVLITLEKLRDLAAIGTIAVVAVLVLVLLANWLGDAGSVWPKATIEALASIHSIAKDIADGYGRGISLFGVIGAGIVLWWAGRQAKRRVLEVWMQKANDEHAALRSDPSRIDAARQDPELLPIVQQLDVALAEINKLEQAEIPDEVALAQTHEALSSVLSMLAIESARKHIDFPEAAGQPATAEKSASNDVWQRLLAVFSSKRLGTDLALVRKPLGWIVTGLLFVSLVGWASEPLANSLQLAVNNLRVQFDKHEAQRHLDEVLSRTSEKAPDTDVQTTPYPNAVQAASRLLTHAIVREMSRAPLQGVTANARRGAQSEAEFVRLALAEQHLPATSSSDDIVTRVRSEVAESVVRREPIAVSPTARHVSEELQPTLERLHAKDPSRLTAIIARLEARYATPMAPLDAQGKLIEKLLDDAFGAAEMKPESELGKQAQKLSKDFGKKAIQTWADTTVKQFLADALSSAARLEVQRAFAFETSKQTGEFIASLQEHEGKGWQKAPAMEREAQMAGKVAEKVAALHGDVDQASLHALADRMGGYDRIFPADHGPIPPPAEAMPGGGGGGGGGGGSGAKHGSGGQPHAAPGRMATNFHLASRSFRVRGVLVGQELEGSSLDVTDIRWRILAPARSGEATRVTVELRATELPRNVSTWKVAGTFDAGVLNQAIRYSADRRVVATTITAGDGRAISRLTYLHPVLADTPLGCRVIESDRIVDTFTMAGEGRRPAPLVAELAADREQMHHLLAILQLAEIVATKSGARCPIDQVQQVLDQRKFAQVRFSATLEQALGRFTSERATALAGSDSFFRKARMCASGPVDGLAKCLCEQVSPGGLPAHYWFPEDHTSQVREHVAKLDSDMAWLRPSSDRLAHLDFWTHATFALRDGNTGVSDESNTAAFDFPPIHLSALRKEVSRSLPNYVAKQLRFSNYDDFMRPLEEFVLAQRLIRAAFDGKLGHDFPLQRLIEIEKLTRRFVPKQPTLRWEPVASPSELLEMLSSADSEAGKLYKDYQFDILERTRTKRPVCDPVSG